MIFSSATEALPHLLNQILSHGSVVPSRNGETRERLMAHITIESTIDPYIVTPGRNVSLPAQIAETMWVLAGREDVEWLSHYLPKAPEFSDDGKIWRGAYGPRIRHWGYEGFDQLSYVIDLLRKDPDTRRAVINLYDPSVDSTPGKDIPCNNWLHFIARDGVLTTHVATRSNDVMWGWSGINLFEWSILTQVIAAFAGLTPGSITFDISSLHLYERHYDKAQRIVDQTLLADNDLDAGMWNDDHPSVVPWFGLWGDYRGLSPAAVLEDQLDRWFTIEEMIRHRRGIDADAVRAAMPAGLFREWLLVINAWWSQNYTPIKKDWESTSMYQALVTSPDAPSVPDEDTPTDEEDYFLASINRLHRDKGAVYGISWRKRGETYSILPNIGRKIDRLGVGGAGDSEADTYVDLVVYLTKYRAFLQYGTDPTINNGNAVCDDPDFIAQEFERLQESSRRSLATPSETFLRHGTQALKDKFEALLQQTAARNRQVTVQSMLPLAWKLAEYVAEKEGWEY